mmetsp:Transcript_29721/g.88201  ORF Transcript_29721/g.88201 Transcript_29721/m.88201 type:complete len:591 (-) Transcript_29721:1202-2974(-)
MTLEDITSSEESSASGKTPKDKYLLKADIMGAQDHDEESVELSTDCKSDYCSQADEKGFVHNVFAVKTGESLGDTWNDEQTGTKASTRGRGVLRNRKFIFAGQKRAAGLPPSSAATRNGDVVTEEEDLATAAADFDELRTLLPAIRRAIVSSSSSSRCPGVSTNLTTGQRRQSLVESVVAKSLVQYSSGMSDLGGSAKGNYDDEDNAKGMRLPMDMYGLIYFAPPCHPSFFLAVFAFAFQITILTLILVDILERSDKGPHLILPAGVSHVVRASQFFAILVAVATQDDLITAINTVRLGYSDTFIRDGTETREKGGARWQWLFSLFLRGIEGAFCLAVTFILIMQANEATAMFIDFLAVSFVSGIDNSVFLLARSGFFGGANKHKSGEMLRVRVPRKRKEKYHFRPLLFIILSAAMIAGWGSISHLQEKGDYLSCRNIMLQFGDYLHSTLGFYSSVFLFDEMDSSGRPIYKSKEGGNQVFASIISYCHDLKAWTVSSAGSDPCVDWAAKTTESEEYDIMNIEPSQWLVYMYLRNAGGTKRGVPFQHFAMRCNDCEDPMQDACETEGVCKNNECVCNDGWFGLSCQFRDPC